MISLRPFAYLCALCVNRHFNAEDAKIRRGPQRNPRQTLTAVAGRLKMVDLKRNKGCERLV
jgi:hypothetical protein